ncbi:MAG TPA: cytochrome c [Acidimicrobiia bacterium]|nr:cytochrome c [Acidimicrobiia bacterium]
MRRLELGSSLTAMALAVALLVIACGETTSDTGIPPQDPQLVEAGARLYAANCAECHGADLRGTDKGPSHLSIVYEPSHHPDEAFQLAVLRGSPAHHWDFGPMPPVPGLSPEEVEAIIAFVRERQRVEGFESYPP